MSQTPPCRPAFTLLELCIVLAIITILVALLLPALGRSRATAKIVLCQSNLRQIGVALLSYKNDHGDWPDAAFMPAPLYNPHLPGPLLHELLDPYLPMHSNVYHCPGDLTSAYEPTKAASPLHAGTSYCYARGLARAAARAGSIRTPDEFPLLGDKGRVATEENWHPGRDKVYGSQNYLYADLSLKNLP